LQPRRCPEILFIAVRKLFPNLNVKIYDTLYTSRNNFKDVKGHKLSECCSKFNIDNKNCHSAVDDASMTAQLYIAMKKLMPYFVVVENGEIVSKGNKI
jgi:DNA polymerase III alpha subunit (gram-positive type)